MRYIPVLIRTRLHYVHVKAVEPRPAHNAKLARKLASKHDTSLAPSMLTIGLIGQLERMARGVTIFLFIQNECLRHYGASAIIENYVKTLYS